MTRLRTTVLLLLIAALGAGVAIGWAASQSDEVEVRVVARPHADGRIEIGVEHNGQRLLPSQRYVTPELTRTRVGVWLRSSPVTLALCDDDDRYEDDDRYDDDDRGDDDDRDEDDRYDDDDGYDDDCDDERDDDDRDGGGHDDDDDDDRDGGGHDDDDDDDDRGGGGHDDDDDDD